ncbi:hypothetical protein [Sorangium sp. So ce693]|uniref:hypothetical protein n=1 Tax=Sorangium sp. So ce693 TaxID=3133318 RepID=UPI003F605A76
MCRNQPDRDACISACGTCSGDQCVEPAPEGFYGPALLWVGRTVDEPQCPHGAQTTVYRGYETADFPFACSPCRCGEPACALPDDLRTAASLKCGGPAVSVHEPRDILNGTCVVPSSALVNDHQSLVLGATRVTPCEASVEPPPVPQFTLRWYRSGVACGGSLQERTCPSPSKTCVPPDQEHGFAQCIMYLGEGEVTCPEDYPEDVVLYDGMRDERHCTSCECGPPTGSECSLMLVSFRDGACDEQLTAGTASSDAPGCVAATPGETPKSMRAIWQVDRPGSCEPSGGELRGEIVLTGPSTFCCQTRPGENG